MSPVLLRRRVVVVSANSVPFDLVRDFLRPKRSLGLFDPIRGPRGLEAYRLKRSTVIKTPASLPFMQGRPHEFSFECTFRNQKQPREPYDLMKMTNAVDDEVASVNINPHDRSLTCNLPSQSQGPQKVKFENPPVRINTRLKKSNMKILIKILQVFDNQWHKISFGVTPTEITLFCDCKKIQSVKIPSVQFGTPNTLQIIIAKATDSSGTIPVRFRALNSVVIYFKQKNSILA